MDEIVCVKHVGCVADFNHMNATITWASGEVMRSPRLWFHLAQDDRHGRTGAVGAAG